MFKRKHTKQHTDFVYDPETMEPVLHCSICSGEETAGFLDKKTGKFTDIALITNADDLAHFAKDYGIEGQIRRIY